MVKVFLVVIMLLWGGALDINAQIAFLDPSHNSALTQADKYYSRQAYKHALFLYHQAHSADPSLNRIMIRIADCYRRIGNPQRAAFWYERGREYLLDNPGAAWLDYAMVLNNLQRYREARDWYLKYLEHFPDYAPALAYASNINLRSKLINNQMEITALAIEGHQPMFSPCYYQRGLVIVAGGAGGGIAGKLAAWNENPYFDLYYITMSPESRGTLSKMDPRLNSPYHEGPAIFYQEDQQVIFTRNAPKRNGSRKLQLMQSRKLSNGRWKKPTAIKFFTENYSVGHPALNSSAEVLYFVSDMPGGYGGTDLYVSYWSNGQWQKPRNLGPVVNTPGNEQFPFVDHHTLYFSSDGHGGLGGLDIFRVSLDSLTTPQNLGYPLNSSNDDFGIIGKDNMQKGYFTSNRSGKDRIYSFSGTF